MTNNIILILLLVISGQLQAAATTNWYDNATRQLAGCTEYDNTMDAAYRAATGNPSANWGNCASQTGSGTDTTICAGTGSYSSRTMYPYPYVSTNPTYFRYCVSGWKDNCTITGQTRKELNGQCSCPAGQVIVNGACVMPVVQNCPKGQYRPQETNICQPITEDCNSNTTTGGNFFEVNSGTCKSGGGINTVCIGAHPKWCPPFNDCIATGEICSDNVIDVADMNTARPAKVEAAQDKADAAATEAAAAKADAAAAKAAKEAAATQAASDKAAADAVVQSQSGSAPDGTNYLIAVEAAAKAAAAQAAAAIAAANAAAQQAIADAMEAIAAARKVTIDSGYGTIGGNYAGDLAQEGQDAANNGRGAAIGGQGGYPPSGQPNAGTGQENGNCTDCAKEATLQSLKAGTGNTVTKQTGNDHFNDQTPTDEAATAQAAYQAKFNEVKTGLSNLFSFTVTADSELPTFDFGMIKGVDLVIDLNRWSTQLSYVGLMILAFASFIAVRIFLE